MNPSDDWRIPPQFQPDPDDLAYDLDRALSAVVGLRASVPEDAYTAGVLGTERAGQGAVIREDGLVLTIGYLIAEAEEVWLTTNDGRAVQAHVVAYDHTSGFGLVQALSPLGVPALMLGSSRHVELGDPVVVAGAGGRERSITARVVARQEFAGYWEYMIDDALFTLPAHPNWGGTAMLGAGGELLGIGSLQLQYRAPEERVLPLNMNVPIDLLKPILDDLMTRGKVSGPPRPWLGLYATQDERERVVLVGLAGDGPAQRAELRAGDVVRAVAGQPVGSLADFYRALWNLGPAGVDVPLTMEREGDVFDMRVGSSDRERFLKAARRH
ncbi:S1-C subfamily serine protease [Azospirillum brasilense]|uniref:S1-C subfamily serine protease n=1 Tax=Azospirillum brasilense TaxID=192 RepID=A0A560BPN1_AZOBR|nr:S1C family serine protease [Azospirillum brasilense]TWA74561.1 S1-C subfamily serine protease [Azospirillum brasilense]